MAVETSTIEAENIAMRNIEETVKHIVRNIKDERIRQNKSQLELAYSAGMSQSFLAAIELNKKIPSITTIVKIAEALGVEPALFFQIDANKQKVKDEIINLLKKI